MSAHRIAIHLTEWADRIHWTIFDADPDYESGQVEGAIVPWDSAEWHDERSLSHHKALRRALIAAANKFYPTEGVEVVLSLADAAVMALELEASRGATGEQTE